MSTDQSTEFRRARSFRAASRSWVGGEEGLRRSARQAEELSPEAEAAERDVMRAERHGSPLGQAVARALARGARGEVKFYRRGR